ncbi:MAG: hypothetical protein ABJE95_08885 [Byssovorax sp.]
MRARIGAAARASQAWPGSPGLKPEDRFQTPRELWSAFLALMRVELGR